MSRLIRASIAAALLIFVTACGKCEVLTWQEQYDLGVRYLSEGNYEEAILSFQAAIEIEPNRVEAYIELAKVYVEQGNIQKALDILNDGFVEIQSDWAGRPGRQRGIRAAGRDGHGRAQI